MSGRKERDRTTKWIALEATDHAPLRSARQRSIASV